ncbi:M23 family metallopeptidase [Rathayibacter sp. VKM Ac-2630]|uniref:M23 family metallopeptidase n=1 Tax=Rathayibacter sp. VKM Ac-2630 TaxID=1938617 RepID=UPI000982448F|nr:M23 family metallopeptidase [Rathayibacter sp. VKM Ac-2630]OOB90282.1 hypothetical protein B0T42_12330 [Rathayibacter sp. VKM Ac-2630]
MQIIKAARGRMTSPFGAKNVPGANVKSHGGTDWGHGNATKDDLRIVAPAAGTVTVAGWFGTYGNRIVIDHGRDENGDHWETLIAHLAEFLAEVGDQVEQAEEIGVMGNTGTKYVHCHQELRRNGRQVDPALYLAATGGGATTVTAPPEEYDMQLSDIIEIDDLKGGKQKVYISTLLNHLFVHVTAAADAAKVAAAGSRDQPFPSTVMVNEKGEPQPVTMGILADHTRVILGGVDARITALTAAVQTLALAQGVDPQALTDLIAEKVDQALKDDFAAIPSTLAASLAS